MNQTIIQFNDERVALTDAAECVQVVDQDSMEMAGIIRRDIASFLKKVDDFFDPVVKTAYLTHQAALKMKTSVRGPAVELDLQIRRSIDSYVSRQKEQEEAGKRAAEEERKRALQEMNEAANKAEEKGDFNDVLNIQEMMDEVFNETPPAEAKIRAQNVALSTDVEVEITDIAEFLGFLAGKPAGFNLAEIIVVKKAALKEAVKNNMELTIPGLKYKKVYRSKLPPKKKE
jgi:Skp family chaperone for outer membrane proteins